MTEPLLVLDDLHRDYLLPRQRLFGATPRLHAVRGVSITIQRGESFGVVGESGCGKSTLARSVVALEEPTHGTVTLRGKNLFSLKAAELRDMRRHVQMVFQDPYGSLDPRHKVGRIVAEPYLTLIGETTRQEIAEIVAAVLEDVGLKRQDADKFPHEFSGGQRQRIAIARALITKPDLIVADEAVSALDVSVQAQVLNLMMKLRAEHGLAYLFISHDLSVVRHVTDRVAIMYYGRIVEQGNTREVFAEPSHPYTKMLLKSVPGAVPKGKKERTIAEDIGEVPQTGCPFAPRCPNAETGCRDVEPELKLSENGHLVACHLV